MLTWQVAIFVALAMVLRRKPDVLIGVLPALRENAKYQGQDKLPVIVWMIAQVSGKQFSTTNGSIWHTKAVSCYFSPLNMLISVSKFSFIGLSRGAGCWVVLVGTQSFADSWWQKLQSTVQGYNFAACGEVWKLRSLPLFFLLQVLSVVTFFFLGCRILSSPKARTILVNGAVRKGERLVPPSALETLLRLTFPTSSARVKVCIV